MRRNVFFILATLATSLPAFAQDGGSSSSGMIALGAGLALGIAALGGALAQGKIGAAAMDGIARNPQAQSNIFTPMIIALVFVETLVLFTFVLAFMIQGNI